MADNTTELKIYGKLTVKLDKQDIKGKQKQDFVIETLGAYPKLVAFQAYGDKVDILDTFHVGNTCTVWFNPESREYSGRYYTNLNMWKLQKD